MKKPVIFIASLLLSPLALANDVQYGMISLDASATEEVANDEMVTTLEVFEDGKDVGKLSDLVNKKTTLLLDAVKEYQAVKAETTNYNTNPIYDDGDIKSWQVSQQITLETGDFEQMSQLLADINSLAHIQSMQFRVSDKQVEAVKKSLLKEAIQNFRNKADEIKNQFDSSDYKLVSLSVNGNNYRPMPMMARQQSYAVSAASAKEAAPAALSGGTNEVSVQVNGTIQLQ